MIFRAATASSASCRIAPPITISARGRSKLTGNPLDVTIDGDAFLVVQTPQGERYTRNGALQPSPQGQLVTNDGYAVVGENGPITFQPNDRVYQHRPRRLDHGARRRERTGRGRARQDPPRLLRSRRTTAEAGFGLYSAPAGVATAPAPLAGLRQGAIEKSNVNSVVEMGRMIEVMRTYQERFSDAPATR